MWRPNIAWINITERCNNRCPYCYAKNSLGERNKDISLDDAKQIIEKLIMLKAERCILMGGEPTLHPNAIEIFKYAADRELGINMISNGTRFADEAFCKSFAEAGLGTRGSTVLSMHASSEEDSLELTGSKAYFSFFTKGLENLIAYKATPGISIVISRANRHRITKMMDFLRAHTIENIHFNLASPSASVHGVDSSEVLPFKELAEAVEEIYQHGKATGLKTRFLLLAPFCILPGNLYLSLKREGLVETGCSVRTGSGITVNTDGDIVPCNHFLDFPIISKGTFGAITHRAEYIKILNSPKMKSMRKSVRVFRSGSCQSCSEFTLCQGGGCPLFWLNKEVDQDFDRWQNRKELE